MRARVYRYRGSGGRTAGARPQAEKGKSRGVREPPRSATARAPRGTRTCRKGWEMFCETTAAEKTTRRTRHYSLPLLGPATSRRTISLPPSPSSWCTHRRNYIRKTTTTNTARTRHGSSPRLSGRPRDSLVPSGVGPNEFSQTAPLPHPRLADENSRTLVCCRDRRSNRYRTCGVGFFRKRIKKTRRVVISWVFHAGCVYPPELLFLYRRVSIEKQKLDLYTDIDEWVMGQ